MEAPSECEVLVVGGGNAGLCAAIAAAEGGANVVLVDKAAVDERGGNTSFTGALFRVPFRDMDDLRGVLADYTDAELADVEISPYTEAQFSDDLERVTEGLTDPALAHVLVTDAFDTIVWLKEKGVRWLLASGRMAFRTGGKLRFQGNVVLEASGGGIGLVDRQLEIARAMGVTVLFETKATALEVAGDGSVAGVSLSSPAGRSTVAARSIVLTCGGFEASPEMRTRYLGPEWDLAVTRGTRHNTGDGLRMALDIGASSAGHWSRCHATAWDAFAPPYGDIAVGDVYQRHSYQLGIVVNREGRRFLDEGADFRVYTYAKYGRELLKQPGRIAYQIFDAKVAPLLLDLYRLPRTTRVQAGTLEELAAESLIERDPFLETVERFNHAVGDGDFDPTILDGKGTSGVAPPKSNWAQPIDMPPFHAYPVTCGITFTFGGLRIDADGRVLDTTHRAIPGLYGAGEIMGGIFYFNYVGGAGLTSGSVFGRRAGRSAAAAATNA